MKKHQPIKIIVALALVLAFSSCVSKKKKKCDTCPTWGAIEAER